MARPNVSPAATGPKPGVLREPAIAGAARRERRRAPPLYHRPHERNPPRDGARALGAGPIALAPRSPPRLARRTGCGGVEDAGPDRRGEDCSTEAVNPRLYEHMKDVHPGTTRSRTSILARTRAPRSSSALLRYKDLDRWSRLTRGDQTAAYFGEGVSSGSGPALAPRRRGRRPVSRPSRRAARRRRHPARRRAPRAERPHRRRDRRRATLWETILGEDEEGLPVDLELASLTARSSR